MRALCAVLIAALLVAYFCWPRAEPTPPTPVTPPPAAAPVEPPIAASIPALTPLQSVRPGEPTLRMPDGKEFPMLNGVREAPAPSWEPGRPYSPIVGRRTVKGIEYYVHADGSTTTTIMAWRTDLKRYDGTTRVESPKEAQGILEDPAPGAVRRK